MHSEECDENFGYLRTSDTLLEGWDRMATHRSAEKAHRQNLKKRARNRELRSRLRGELKSIRSALANNDLSATAEALPRTVSFIDRIASKGVIHANTASRYKSRLKKNLEKISAG